MAQTVRTSIFLYFCLMNMDVGSWREWAEQVRRADANCLQIKGRANLSIAHQQTPFLFSVGGVEPLSQHSTLFSPEYARETLNGLIYLILA